MSKVSHMAAEIGHTGPEDWYVYVFLTIVHEKVQLIIVLIIDKKFIESIIYPGIKV